VVPFNSFAEWSDLIGASGKKHGNTWFAFDDERPLAFFAGIMAPQWTSIRRVGHEALTTDLFAFLTTEPNLEVRAVQESMPVILQTAEEIELWLTAPWEEARQLQRPLPDGSLRIVSTGNKEDPPEPAAAAEMPEQPTLF
jgi:putative SOS response-associated peptidase YedK